MEAGPDDARALVFIGFMGAGKTSVARAVAAEFGERPVDSDQELERRLGQTIETYWERYGETAFREIEEQAVCELLDAPPARVISLGGGAITSEAVQQRLARHTTILLDVDSDTAWQRAGNRNRPLARDRKRFDQLHAARQPLYERLADAILPAGARDAVRRAMPAVHALDGAPPGTKVVWASLPDDSGYPVFVADGLIGSGFWPVPDGRRFVVSDDHVGPLYGARIPDAAASLTMPAGEGAKHLGTVERLLRELTAAGAAHGDQVVALGGGVVGDTAGFCAAIYQRGIPYVQVPTTLVAQVDSAYGGKTGVDLPEGKNYAGAYHQPAAVLTDPATLRTLPPEELAAGWAEVVKTALIAGGPLWKRVKEWAGGGGGEVPDRDLVIACARTKLGVVAEDERDTGRRQVLNLGHTVGHAIETVTGYARYRHGEAVALGLLAACTLSELPYLRAEVAELLAAHGLPTSLDPAIDLEAVADATQKDKKKRGGVVGFVLLDGPGETRTGCPVQPDELRAALAELRA